MSLPARVPKKVLYLYRKLFFQHKDDSFMFSRDILSTKEEARRMLEPICNASSPAELDRMVKEAEETLSRYTTNPELDPCFFHSPGSPGFSYFGSNKYLATDFGFQRPPAPISKRYEMDIRPIVHMPSLPIRNKKEWLEKWKDDPPLIPI